MSEQQDNSGYEIGDITHFVSSTRATRRQVLKGAAAIGGVAALGPIAAACGGDEEGGTEASASASPKTGGTLNVGMVGGSQADTADPHMAAFEPDIAIQYIMYEGITTFDLEAQVVNQMAETIEPNTDGSVWQVKLKDGMLWHDGKPVTADDVVYSFEDIVDPKAPKSAAASLSGLAPGSTVKIDDLTVEFRLETPNVIFPEGLAFRGSQVIPQGFDPKNPIGSGPFKMADMRPGEQFTFAPFADYYGGPPYVDQLVVTEFKDDTARINALNSGQIQAMSQLPRSQVKVIEATSGQAALIASTGAWRPFCMNMSVKPFNDLKVRQAFRLIADRQQMIDQAYSGLGDVANDMYARYDPGTPDVPQREQDLEQAKSLLKQAGYDNDLTVELVTSEADLSGDDVAAAQVYSEQAMGAGVTVKVRNTDQLYNTEPGYYLDWPFSGDFWNTRNYLAQAGQCSMPGAPYNETHWENAEWLAIVKEAFATVDEAKRNELIGQAMTMEYETGGYIIWSWRPQVDAYSSGTIAGVNADKLGFPLGRWGFKNVYFV